MSLPPRPPFASTLAWRLLALALLAVLAIALMLLAPRHEPWFDEAQAWLLARDASPWDVVWKYARYEASPSLWHLLLAGPAKAGAPPVLLNLISSALAVAGAALLLFRSPFPPLLRALLPMGFFFFYQYGIVARTTSLFIPVLWLVAMVYPRRFAQPWRYVGMLILLSQVSLHAAWIAGALMTVFAWDAWRREGWTLTRCAPFVAAFAVDTALILAQLWPPADQYTPPWVANSGRTMGVLREMWLDSVVPWPALSVLVLLAACAFFYTRGVLLSYLLTTGGLLAIFAFRFFSIWHQGMLFALLVFHVWLALKNPVRRPIGQIAETVWPRLTTGALTLTAVVHVYWAAMAGWHDWQLPYSGTREAARYFREHGLDRERIHTFKFTTAAVLLYLDRNPFGNVAPFMPGAFWIWTKEVFAGQTPAAVIQGAPPWVFVGAQLRPAVEPTPPALPGYAIERIFPGRMVWKDDFYRTDSYYLYRRTTPEPAR